MKAMLLVRRKFAISDIAFVEIVVWEVPIPVLGSRHNYKYSLALVVESQCVLRYDNEAGKGDHKHVDGRKQSYTFSTLTSLFNDFFEEAERRTRK